MRKINLHNLLEKGTLKKRLLILFEDIARAKLFKERLLTDLEAFNLQESFRTPKELKEWMRYKKLEDIVTNAINNLQGLKFEVLMNYSNLRGYILVWNSIENAELLVNSVLHEIKDIKERKRIATHGAKGIDLLLSHTEPDQEGYIKIDINYSQSKDYKLYELMSNVKDHVDSSLVRYKSWETAILTYMEEEDFNIKTYRETITDMREDINTPIIGWDKYSGELNTGLSHPRLSKVIKKYAICPNVDEIKVDEKHVAWFNKNILNYHGK